MKALEALRTSSLQVGKRRQPADPVARYLARMRTRASFARMAFVGLVLLPTLAAAIYYGIIASKRYASEAKFVVRSASSPRSTGFDAFLRTMGVARSVDDSNAIEEYLLSRDAVRGLEARLPLRQFFARPEADIFARFPYVWRGDSFERLYEYYKNRVIVTDESTKGLVELKVIAFRPEDAFEIAQALLDLAEAMANRLNERAEDNALKDARADVALARKTLVSAQTDLTNFRNQELLVDPSQNSVKVLDTIADLSTDLATLLTQIDHATQTAPGNPAIAVWRAQVEALRRQVTVERSKLAGGNGALAAKVASYEQLSLMRDLANKGLEVAEASLALARQDAERKKIYVEQIVAPNVPDQSTEPRRLRSVAMVFVVGFAIFGVLWLVRAGVSEHAL